MARVPTADTSVATAAPRARTGVPLRRFAFPLFALVMLVLPARAARIRAAGPPA